MRNNIQAILAAAVLIFGNTAHAEKPKAFIFAPSEGTGPFPVALWLHGYRGYSPDGYFPGETSAAMQKHADKLGAVLIGFPATTELGDGTQQWSEEPVADHAYIQATLNAISKTNRLDLTRVGLFGFSQGASVAADLATLYPESYCGAILMSPGGMGSPKPLKTKLLAHSKQVFYCFCGAQEHPYNVGLTKAYARLLDTVLGAHVTLKLYEGVSKHTRPADFMEKFPDWMGEILKKHQ
jgi:predicted esterase